MPDSDARSEKRYNVNVIFRGLFLAQWTDDHFEVFLPDARRPKGLAPDEDFASKKDEFQAKIEKTCDLKDKVGLYEELVEQYEKNRVEGPAYREHYGIVEFPIADWANPTRRFPWLVQASHWAKEDPSAFYFLDFQTLRFSSLIREPRLPAELLRDPACYISPASSKHVKILEKDCIYGLDQLPQFNAEPLPDPGEASVGKILFDVGEVFSERRSEEPVGDGSEVRPILWEQRRFGKVYEESEEARPVNLDLHVRFSLWSRDSLRVDVVDRNPPTSAAKPLWRSNSLPTSRHTFLFHPREAGSDLTIWIKNRELEQILQDSDLLPDIFDRRGEMQQALDADHGQFSRLATPSSRKDAVILRTQRDGSSNCGAGCGGCSGGNQGGGGGGD